MKSLYIPLRIYSQANISEHWSKKYKRNKEISRVIRLLWETSELSDLKLPVLIKFIREAPRSLDSDNLVMAFKTARDTVSDLLIPGLAPGRADGGAGIDFEYGQQKNSSYGFRIEALEITNII